jgi:hypothetical protein
MKNKINEIWYQRAYLLDKLFYQTRWLINCNKPLSHKNAILKENFDRFVLSLLSQDKELNKLLKEPSKLPLEPEKRFNIKTAQDMRKYIQYLKT